MSSSTTCTKKNRQPHDTDILIHLIERNLRKQLTMINNGKIRGMMEDSDNMAVFLANYIQDASVEAAVRDANQKLRFRSIGETLGNYCTKLQGWNVIGGGGVILTGVLAAPKFIALTGATLGGKVVADTIANGVRKYKWKSLFRTIVGKLRTDDAYKTNVTEQILSQIVDDNTMSLWSAEEDKGGALVAYARSHLNLAWRVLVQNLPVEDNIGTHNHNTCKSTVPTVCIARLTVEYNT
jgi:hypothetical protein